MSRPRFTLRLDVTAVLREDGTFAGTATLAAVCADGKSDVRLAEKYMAELGMVELELFLQSLEKEPDPRGN